MSTSIVSSWFFLVVLSYELQLFVSDCKSHRSEVSKTVDKERCHRRLGEESQKESQGEKDSQESKNQTEKDVRSLRYLDKMMNDLITHWVFRLDTNTKDVTRVPHVCLTYGVR